MSDLPLYWIGGFGLAFLVLLGGIIFYGYRKGWFEAFGFGPPNQFPRHPSRSTHNDPREGDEALALLRYIQKRLDVVHSRVELLDVKIDKARKQLKTVEDLAREMRERLPKSQGAWEVGQQAPRQVSQAAPPPVTQANAAAASGKADSIEAARGVYQMLADDRLPASHFETIFADLKATAQGAVIGEMNYCFRPADNRHSQFVIIPRNGTTGWLFPNPTILFTEAMKVVFPNLSREQFEDNKNRIDPLPVKVGQSGMWEGAS